MGHKQPFAQYHRKYFDEGIRLAQILSRKISKAVGNTVLNYSE